jgi:hypothetical protein
MRIRAQFARQEPPAKAWRVLCGALLLVAIVFCVLAWNSRQRTKALIAEAEAARAAAIYGTAKTSQATALRPPPPYEASAGELLALHAVPWPALLAALENGEVPGVRVTSIDYDAQSASARVELAFTPPASPLALLEQLNVGVPAVGEGWRWKVVEIDQRTDATAGRAVFRAEHTVPTR